jgi:hypothetical protein
MFPKNFVDSLVQALLHVLITIAKVFVLPLNLWTKSTVKLVEQKENGTVDMLNINSPWPYFTWCKRWIIDFLFDALSFLSYPVGVLVSVFAFVYSCTQTGFGASLAGLIISLVSVYFVPLFIIAIHDVIVFVLLPINKFIDWLKKPAQHLEIKATQDVKVKKEE